MRLRFWWPESSDTPRPAAESDRLNHDGISLLASVLTDQGGGHWQGALPWIREGLSMVERVRRGEVDAADWSRDTFGVDLHKDRARIYSLYVEDYDESMDLDDFDAALRAWLRFLEAGPQPGATLVEL
jgi:hypothetical protein